MSEIPLTEDGAPVKTDGLTETVAAKQLYFDREHRSFYDSSIHSEIPPSAVVITSEQHQALLAAVNNGDGIGSDLSIIPRPSTAHEWRGGRWVLNKQQAAEQTAAELAAAKTAKLAELNRAAQAHIDAVCGASALPAYEVQSWVLQGTEAKAWAADPAAPTPILDAIAAARGLPAATLKQAALRKTLAYEALTAQTAGQRQAQAGQIAAADSLDKLSRIAIQFGDGA